ISGEGHEDAGLIDGIAGIGIRESRLQRERELGSGRAALVVSPHRRKSRQQAKNGKLRLAIDVDLAVGDDRHSEMNHLAETVSRAFHAAVVELHRQVGCVVGVELGGRKSYMPENSILRPVGGYNATSGFGSCCRSLRNGL